MIRNKSLDFDQSIEIIDLLSDQNKFDRQMNKNNRWEKIRNGRSVPNDPKNGEIHRKRYKPWRKYKNLTQRNILILIIIQKSYL